MEKKHLEKTKVGGDLGNELTKNFDHIFFIIRDLITEVTSRPSNITKGIKKTAASELEGKCNSFAYVMKVLEAEQIPRQQYISLEDSFSSTIHLVRTTLQVCAPIKGSKMIACVFSVNAKFILARLFDDENKHSRICPLDIFILENEMPQGVTYNLNDEAYVLPEAGKEIKKGSYIVVTIKNKKTAATAEKITASATILGITSKEMYDKYIEYILKGEYSTKEELIHKNRNIFDELSDDDFA